MVKCASPTTGCYSKTASLRRSVLLECRFSWMLMIVWSRTPWLKHLTNCRWFRCTIIIWSASGTGAAEMMNVMAKTSSKQMHLLISLSDNKVDPRRTSTCNGTSLTNFTFKKTTRTSWYLIHSLWGKRSACSNPISCTCKTNKCRRLACKRTLTMTLIILCTLSWAILLRSVLLWKTRWTKRSLEGSGGSTLACWAAVLSASSYSHLSRNVTFRLKYRSQ